MNDWMEVFQTSCTWMIGYNALYPGVTQHVVWLVTWTPLQWVLVIIRRVSFPLHWSSPRGGEKKVWAQWEQLFQLLPSNRWQTHAVHSPEHSKLMLSNDNHAYRSIKGIFNTISLFKVQGCFWVVHMAQRVMREDTFPCWVKDQTGYWVYRLLHTYVTGLCKSSHNSDCFIIPRCHKACKYNQREQQASWNDGHFSSIFYSHNQTHLLFRHNSENVFHLKSNILDFKSESLFLFCFCFLSQLKLQQQVNAAVMCD